MDNFFIIKEEQLEDTVYAAVSRYFNERKVEENISKPD